MRKPIQERDNGNPGCVLVDDSGGSPEMTCVSNGVAEAEAVRFVCSVEKSRRRIDSEGEAGEGDDDAAYARPGDGLGAEDEAALPEPGARVPYPGVYIPTYPLGEGADAERAGVRGASKKYTVRGSKL
jgi:hypothetical protein